MWSRSIHYPTIASPRQPLVPLAKAIRQQSTCPCSALASWPIPREAEAILAAGEADMMGMTRAHIAEPAIIRKLTKGRAEEIRTCIYCNESCFGRQQRVGDITCVYNPRTGRENIWPALTRASERRQSLSSVAVLPGWKQRVLRRDAAIGSNCTSVAMSSVVRCVPWRARRTGRATCGSSNGSPIRSAEQGVEVRLGSELDADAGAGAGTGCGRTRDRGRR